MVFLLKKPHYFLFGAVLVLLDKITSLPLERIITGTADTFSENSLLVKLFSSFSSPANGLMFLVAFFALLWASKIGILSLLSLTVYARQRKKEKPSLLANIQTLLLTLPKMIGLNILYIASITLLALFLTVPVTALIGISLPSAWFLGILAFVIFFISSLIAYSLFLFSHFFILFSRLHLKTALDASARLYQRKKQESLSFLLFFLILFLLIVLVSLFLPSFSFTETGIISPYPEIPSTLNLLGALFSFLLFSLYFTFFPVTSVFFFLAIAKQPPVKELAEESAKSVLAPILKKNPKALPETGE